ncbi:hypothetical protein E3V39_03250 [Gammaproteobacteria bacterium LSUCC0112]|nr:hypothetical protein E3V39_03250 [Gammaproteobacteria bacterium LSUCC0112]
MVINLLPWRQSRYKKRQRLIVQLLMAITVCHLVIGLYIVLTHLERTQLLLQHSTRVQQLLHRAAHDQQSLRQSYELQLAKVQSSQVMLTRWQKNADLQAMLFKWGSLGKSIDVRQVIWDDKGLQLFGEADDAGVIRVLKKMLAAQAQNQQIELSSGGKFQFLMSTTPAEIVFGGSNI